MNIRIRLEFCEIKVVYMLQVINNAIAKINPMIE